MLKNIKHVLGYYLMNAFGWRTKRRIIVIESDDWGAIRMPSSTVRNNLFSGQVGMYNAQTYDRVDNLADSEDLQALFKVLQKYRDHKGNHPIVTANTIVANPDFEKIKASEYKNYYFEKFTTTLEGYPNHQNTLKTWKKGIQTGVFRPQLHGREHVNVALWLKALKNKEIDVLKAFENKTWPARLISGERLDIAYNYEHHEQLQFVLDSIEEGATIFEEIFGYKSKSFIAPSYTWCSIIEKKLNLLGIKYIQGGLYQKYPIKVIKDTNKVKKRHFTGQKNRLQQTYLMRNVHFEPTLTNEVDIVTRCLKDIEIAFKCNKPVIISSHRLNFIGNIEKENRDNTLIKLDQLLAGIMERFPNVEFLSSDQLGDAITNK